MARTRKSRSAEVPGYREPLAYPTLVALVAGLVLFGVMHYSLLLAVGSAIFVGFFGWLWWQRKFAAPAPRTPAPRKRKR
jgi:Flp pilus assembly protein TadB